MNKKVICSERLCRWHGKESETLAGMNPFDADEMILGCPKCKLVNTIVYACDDPDCWQAVTSGNTCSEHYRND